MSKTSSKLAAGVRKLKSKRETTVPVAQDVPVPARRVPTTQPAPLPLHPVRVWPD